MNMEWNVIDPSSVEDCMGLPRFSGNYLFSFKNNRVGILKVEHDCNGCHLYSDLGFTYSIDLVNAWMPLPDAYTN